MNLTERFLRTVVKYFPTHEVSAMGLKLLGDAGSEIAAALAISLTDASLQAWVTVNRANKD